MSETTNAFQRAPKIAGLLYPRSNSPLSSFVGALYMGYVRWRV